MLAVGFSASALAVTAMLHAVGAGIFEGLHVGTGVRLAIAAVVLLACLLVDSGMLGIATPMWRRQTPQRPRPPPRPLHIDVAMARYSLSGIPAPLSAFSRSGSSCAGARNLRAAGRAGPRLAAARDHPTELRSTTLTR